MFFQLRGGGTGATNIAGARAALGLGNTSGAVPITSGGTGATTVASARNNLGLGNTSGAVPIANGGTGATTVALARNALGLGNTSGAVPIANGGTGATTAANACANIGALPVSGGTITGDLRLKGTGNFGNKLRFGDGDYVIISEPTDDVLNLKAKKITLTVSDTDYSTATLHPMICSTTDLTAGSSTLANGVVYLVYE